MFLFFRVLVLFEFVLQLLLVVSCSFFPVICIVFYFIFIFRCCVMNSFVCDVRIPCSVIHSFDFLFCILSYAADVFIVAVLSLCYSYCYCYCFWLLVAFIWLLLFLLQHSRSALLCIGGAKFFDTIHTRKIKLSKRVNWENANGMQIHIW